MITAIYALLNTKPPVVLPALTQERTHRAV